MAFGYLPKRGGVVYGVDDGESKQLVEVIPSRTGMRRNAGVDFHASKIEELGKLPLESIPGLRKAPGLKRQMAIVAYLNLEFRATFKNDCIDDCINPPTNAIRKVANSYRPDFKT